MPEEPSGSIVDRTFRRESGRAVATLIRVIGDFDAAEEAVQEAFLTAIERWPRDGVPANPGAWITQVARNNAIDKLRRDRNLRDKTSILEGLEEWCAKRGFKRVADLTGAMIDEAPAETFAAAAAPIG